MIRFEFQEGFTGKVEAEEQRQGRCLAGRREAARVTGWREQGVAGPTLQPLTTCRLHHYLGHVSSYNESVHPTQHAGLNGTVDDERQYEVEVIVGKICLG